RKRHPDTLKNTSEWSRPPLPDWYSRASRTSLNSGSPTLIPHLRSRYRHPVSGLTVRRHKPRHRHIVLPPPAPRTSPRTARNPLSRRPNSAGGVDLLLGVT